MDHGVRTIGDTRAADFFLWLRGSGWIVREKSKCSDDSVAFTMSAALKSLPIPGSCGKSVDHEKRTATRSDMARLLSVNVGLPRDIAWKGRTVHTAIWKDPVAGRRRVDRLNIDGDGQGDLAGHGGEQRAVYRLPDRILPLLAGAAETDRFRPRAIRRELHDRRIARRCGVHRRSLSDRQRPVRGDAAARHLLSRRHSDERAAHAGAAHIERTAGILPPRARSRATSAPATRS